MHPLSYRSSAGQDNFSGTKTCVNDPCTGCNLKLHPVHGSFTQVFTFSADEARVVAGAGDLGQSEGSLVGDFLPRRSTVEQPIGGAGSAASTAVLPPKIEETQKLPPVSPPTAGQAGEQLRREEEMQRERAGLQVGAGGVGAGSSAGRLPSPPERRGDVLAKLPRPEDPVNRRTPPSKLKKIKRQKTEASSDEEAVAQPADEEAVRPRLFDEGEAAAAPGLAKAQPKARVSTADIVVSTARHPPLRKNGCR